MEPEHLLYSTLGIFVVTWIARDWLVRVSWAQKRKFLGAIVLNITAAIGLSFVVGTADYSKFEAHIPLSLPFAIFNGLVAGMCASAMVSTSGKKLPHIQPIGIGIFAAATLFFYYLAIAYHNPLIQELAILQKPAEKQKVVQSVATFMTTVLVILGGLYVSMLRLNAQLFQFSTDRIRAEEDRREAHRKDARERFLSAVELASSERVSSRITGLLILEQLASEFSEVYNTRVNRVVATSIQDCTSRRYGANQSQWSDYISQLFSIFLKTREEESRTMIMRGLYLSGLSIDGASDETTMTRIVFQNCNLKTAHFNNMVVKADFVECNLRGARFRNSHIEGSEFERCDLRRARALGSCLKAVALIECQCEDFRFNCGNAIRHRKCPNLKPSQESCNQAQCAAIPLKA